MGSHVANTAVRADAPSLSDAASLQILGYSTLMLRTFLICGLAGLRIQRANQSAFENNSVFTLIGVVALSAVAMVGVFLLADHTRPMKQVVYTVLKFIGSFSAFLAPFSLLMVIVLPPKLNLIGIVAAFVMFALIVICFYLDDQKHHKRQSTFNDLALVYVAFLIWSGFMFPTSCDWIVYPVIQLSLWMEAAYHFITYLMFIYLKTRKPSNLEAHRLIQEDENNNRPQYHYLTYLMQFGSSSF